MTAFIHDTLTALRKSSPGQDEFYQSAGEVLECLQPLLDAHPRYREHGVIRRIVEPERQILFRVCWHDDDGVVQVNKGYRIQFNSALGPYKGGLRFHHSVNAGIIKFLGFEQIFKNALTGLPIGGAKGGSNFDPHGKSDNELMRFCQSFMNELFRYIGPNMDIPAGDIGVGAREIGYLFGQYKRLTRHYEGVLTGKGLTWGGSLGRKQATGYGTVYFAQHMLAARDQNISGKTCLVSGAGNVAIYTIEKLYQLEALPITCSDSGGTIHHKAGIDLDTLKKIKEVQRGSLRGYVDQHPDATWIPRDDYPDNGHAVWRIPADVAFPSATQNEVTAADAETLIANGVTCLAEGSNMGSTTAAIKVLQDSPIAYGPGKAANAGGVAVSQLEMAQNASMQCWSTEQVDTRLQNIMAQIYRSCTAAGAEFGRPDDLVLGANVAGFRKVANAMIEQGLY